MILEKIVLVLSSFIITAYVARYLGPSEFGYLSYVISFLSIGFVISNFGCNTLIFQSAAKSLFLAKNFIRVSQLIRIIILTFFLGFAVIYLFFNKSIGTQGDWLVYGLAISLFFQSMDCYSFYYDATLKSRLNFLANTASVILALLVRSGLVFFSLPLAFFSLPYIINYAVSFFIKRFSYSKEEKVKSINLNTLFPAVLKRGLPIFLSEISVLIYTRMTVLFVEYFKSATAVGGFSAVYTITGTWIVFPITIVNAMFTIIFKTKDNRSKNELSQGVICICLLGASTISIVTYFFSENIMYLVYGAEYAQYHDLLSIMMFSSVFSLIGYIGNRIIIAYKAYSYLARKMIAVAVVSVLLNITLIPSYGLQGAAYSMLLTEFFSATIANYFYSKGLIYKIHINAIFKPVYSVSKILRVYINE